MIAETSAGLFCEPGGFHIDPWLPVERAVITHAHSDHARPGSAAYLCAEPGEPLLRRRLPDARIETLPYGRRMRIGDVDVSFHPAGHILGSAQIRMEHRGDVWVASGDYKRAADPTCAPFEPVRCNTFITEATFALPIYTWDMVPSVIGEIVDWWRGNREQDRPSVLFCYVLGKAQRILAELNGRGEGPIHLHGAMWALTGAYREAGVTMAAAERIGEDMRGRALARSLVLAPLSARGTPWMRRLPNASDAFASGLMRVRGVRRQRAFDRGFVLSDHADWKGLLATVDETGASRVLVTHGWSEALARYLAETRHLETRKLKTAYEGEAGELEPRTSTIEPRTSDWRRFTELYDALDRTTSTNAKVAALAEYFREAPAADAAWATFFLTGRRLKRLVPSAALRDWTQQLTQLPEWLFRECYSAAGDFAELMALVLDTVPREEAEPDLPLATWVEERLLPLLSTDLTGQRAAVTGWWLGLPRGQRFVLNKLITGEFRVGVAQTLVVRALARAIGSEPTLVAARLMGDWTPSAAWFASIAVPPGDAGTPDPAQPYPFFLASPLEGDPEALGDRRDWLVEWKWDGIRAQLVRRGGQVWLWSRGEELITTRFPEIAAAATHLPDGTVLDGEVLAFREERPMPFSALQQRIGRQRQLAQIVRAVPVVFVAYDVMEHAGVDLRSEPLSARRAVLRQLVSGDGVLRLSGEVESPSWDELARLRLESRDRGVEGFILKRRDSAYGVGRRKGAWWKWKIDPLTVDAVLIYAQPGNGRRASLLTDYTFGVWHEGELVPVAKAYSGLSNAEIDELDTWIRRHTRERHGPVRAVDPVQVFELGFEAIAPSSRHKSGIAVRFPRMLRWRRDKPASEADTLENLTRLLR